MQATKSQSNAARETVRKNKVKLMSGRYCWHIQIFQRGQWMHFGWEEISSPLLGEAVEHFTI